MSDNITNQLTYLNETKQMLKQAIIDKGQALDDTTPFRNYVAKVSAIETGVNTDDATATANDLINPRTAYIGGKKVTGAITPTYGVEVSSKIQVPITFSTALWDIFYSEKLVAVQNSTSSFRLTKIKNGSVDYANAKSISTSAIGMSYAIADVKFSNVVVENKAVIWVLGKSGGGAYGNTNYHSITRVEVDINTLNVVSYYNTNYTLGSNYVNNYCMRPRPNSNTDVGIAIGYNNSLTGIFGLNLLRFNGSSFVQKLNYSVTTRGANFFSAVPAWCYWTEDGNYLQGECTNNARIVVYSVDSAANCTSVYNNTTYRKILNGGYYLQGTTVYNMSGTSVGSSVYNFSSNQTFSMVANLIFIQNSAATTSIYTLNENHSITKLTSVTTSSSVKFMQPKIAYLYDIGTMLDGYTSETEPEIIQLTRNTENYYRTLDANAGVSQVLTGRKFYNSSGLQTGSMPNNGALSYTPRAISQSIPLGYTSGGTIAGDSNLISSSIRADKSIFGIVGSAPITFATVEELEANTNFPEDTFAIVYGTSYVGTYRLDNGTWTQIGDSSQNQQIMDVLNDVANSTDQYEGNGGTDEEISAKLDMIIYGQQS